MPGAWNFLFQTVFARGYTRLPVLLAPPLIWKYYMEDFMEDRFKAWNAGHNQIDVWNRLAKKVKEQGEAAH